MRRPSMVISLTLHVHHAIPGVHVRISRRMHPMAIRHQESDRGMHLITILTSHQNHKPHSGVRTLHSYYAYAGAIWLSFAPLRLGGVSSARTRVWTYFATLVGHGNSPACTLPHRVTVTD